MSSQCSSTGLLHNKQRYLFLLQRGAGKEKRNRNKRRAIIRAAVAWQEGSRILAVKGGLNRAAILGLILASQLWS